VSISVVNATAILTANSSNPSVTNLTITADQMPKSGTSALTISSPSGVTQGIFTAGLYLPGNTAGTYSTSSATPLCGEVQLEYDAANPEDHSFVAGAASAACSIPDGGTVSPVSVDITSMSIYSGTAGTIDAIYTAHGCLTATMAQIDCGTGCAPTPGVDYVTLQVGF
jgi:hypothetical protein